MKTVPYFAKLFIEVQVETDSVLNFDALLDHYLLKVCLQAHLLKLPLEILNSTRKTHRNEKQSLYMKSYG